MSCGAVVLTRPTLRLAIKQIHAALLRLKASAAYSHF
jgi:hypothetical protein